MRHLLTLLRLVINAAPSALAFAFLLASLVIILNPEVEPHLPGMLGVWAVLAVAYGLPLLAGFPLAVAAVRFFAARPLRIGWLHLKSVVWFLVAGVGLAMAVYAWNLAEGGDLIADRPTRGLSLALALVSLNWGAGAILAAVAQMRGSEAGERPRRAALVFLAASLPASLLGWSASPRLPRGSIVSAGGEAGTRRGSVVIVALEGATLSEVLPLVAEGRLPALAGMTREGAWGPLATLHPCRSAPAWATLSTGRNPGSHGIRDVGLYRLAGMEGELRSLPAGVFFRRWLSPAWLSRREARGADLRCRSAWEILDHVRVEATFLGWPLTGQGPDLSSQQSESAPGEAGRWYERIAAGAPPDAALEEPLRRAVASDTATGLALLRLLQTEARGARRVAAAHLGGLGIFSRALPEPASGGSAEEIEATVAWDTEGILARYYEALDQWIGEVRASLGPEDYLIVVSAYGREPFPLLKRLTRRAAGLPARGVGHDTGPAGIFLVAGPGVAGGRSIDNLGIADVVPLTLYLMGLPVGRDMDGRLPRRILARPFLEANPITFIASYG